MPLSLEELEARRTPAAVDLSGGTLAFAGGPGESTGLVVAVSGGVYSLRDTNVIVLGPGAVAAGYRGSGTKTVSGPAAPVTGVIVTPGAAGPNVVAVRSAADPIEVDDSGTTGPTAVHLSSDAPIDSGNLAGIRGAVSVVAGPDTSLSVAGVTDAARPSTVVIDPAGVHGLAPADIAVSGTIASLTVRGSNSSTLAESFELAGSPALACRLDTLGGPDSVTVTADTTADVYLGGGDDLLTVLAGVTLTGDVHTGGQAGDVVLYGPPSFGVITGAVLP